MELLERVATSNCIDKQDSVISLFLVSKAGVNKTDMPVNHWKPVNYPNEHLCYAYLLLELSIDQKLLIFQRSDGEPTSQWR